MWLGKGVCEGVIVSAEADTDHCCLRLLVAVACSEASSGDIRPSVAVGTRNSAAGWKNSEFDTWRSTPRPFAVVQPSTRCVDVSILTDDVLDVTRDLPRPTK